MGGRGKSTKSLSDQTTTKLPEGEKRQCQRCKNDCGKDHMKCNMCDSTFHTKCEGVSPQQLSLFRELDKLKTPYEWLCSSCRKIDVMNIMKSIQMMKSKIEILEKEVASLKQNSCNSDTFVEPRSSQPSSPDTISDAVNEAIDIERRKLNLVVSGMPQLQEKSDVEQLKLLLEDPVLNLEGSVFVQNVQRIGNKGHLLITFDSIENKRAVLRSAYRLRGSTFSDHRSIFLSPDLTRKQRQAEFELRAELKSRRERGEVGLKISKGKIVRMVDQGSQNVSTPRVSTPRVSTPHVIRVSPGGSMSTVPVNENRTKSASRVTQMRTAQVARSDSVKNSGIPRPAGACGASGSVASVEVTGSLQKN